MPVVKYYNPNTSTWEEISTAGAQGLPGPSGPTGPTGPAGASTLDDLTDVDTSTNPPQDGDGLVWDAAAGEWVPGPGGGGEEVAIADVAPTDPALELWVDTLSPTPEIAVLGDFTPNATWAIVSHATATKVDRLVTIEGKLRVTADLTAAPNAPQSIGTFPDEFKPAFEIYGPAIAVLAAGGQWIKVWQRGATFSMVNFSAAPITFVAASNDGIEFSLTYRSLA